MTLGDVRAFDRGSLLDTGVSDTRKRRFSAVCRVFGKETKERKFASCKSFQRFGDSPKISVLESEDRCVKRIHRMKPCKTRQVDTSLTPAVSRFNVESEQELAVLYAGVSDTRK